MRWFGLLGPAFTALVCPIRDSQPCTAVRGRAAQHGRACVDGSGGHGRRDGLTRGGPTGRGAGGRIIVVAATVDAYRRHPHGVRPGLASTRSRAATLNSGRRLVPAKTRVFGPRRAHHHPRRSARRGGAVAHGEGAAAAGEGGGRGGAGAHREPPEEARHLLHRRRRAHPPDGGGVRAHRRPRLVRPRPQGGHPAQGALGRVWQRVGVVPPRQGAGKAPVQADPF